MAKKKSLSETHHYWPYLSIVLIVAIVACVMLYTGSGKSASTDVSEDLAGEAYRGLPSNVKTASNLATESSTNYKNFKQTETMSQITPYCEDFEKKYTGVSYIINESKGYKESTIEYAFISEEFVQGTIKYDYYPNDYTNDKIVELKDICLKDLNPKYVNSKKVRDFHCQSNGLTYWIDYDCSKGCAQGACQGIPQYDDYIIE